METMLTKVIRLGVVGAMNLFIDLTAFYVLMLVFGLDRGGASFILLKSLSFLLALANSYTFNRIWAYQECPHPGHRLSRQVFNFAVIGVLGLIVNTAISYVMFRLGVRFLVSVPSHNIANGAAFAGAMTSAFLNAIAYPFFIFRPQKEKAVLQPKIEIGLELEGKDFPKKQTLSPPFFAYHAFHSR